MPRDFILDFLKGLILVELVGGEAKENEDTLGVSIGLLRSIIKGVIRANHRGLRKMEFVKKDN